MILNNYTAKIIFLLFLVFCPLLLSAQQGTRLLRQPSIANDMIAFTYGSDVWVANRDGSDVKRITSTAAVEQVPVLSPDGSMVAFTSNRSGSNAVYVVPVTGGTPKQLTWHPDGSYVRGWTDDGNRIIYASSRDYAPVGENRLWSISKDGGNGEMITVQRALTGDFSPDESHIVLEQVSRWDVEWRNYRGGQNKPLIVLDLETLEEVLIPNERTTDRYPVWVGERIYFLSDRDDVMNIWSYDTGSGQLSQHTSYEGADIKWLSGYDELIFEREGYLFIFNPGDNSVSPVTVSIIADFPWMETKWENVENLIQSADLSVSGQRVLFQARGDIFTVPVEYGDTRNLTNTSGTADRRPMWSPLGDRIAWFTDENGENYEIKTISQDGMGETRTYSIGESKLGWEPKWSPDGELIAFVDDDLRVRVLNLDNGNIKTIDLGGVNIERGDMGLTWSPDSRWLAYAKSGTNFFRQVMIWSRTEDQVRAVTNAFADSFSPAWDRDGKHFYFLASTDLAKRSGWANTSSITENPNYAAYLVNLDADDPSPFELRSDEEKKKEDVEPSEEESEKKAKGNEKEDSESGEDKNISIDFDGIERRTIALPMPERPYRYLLSGPEGIMFISESVPNESGLTLHKFELKERKATPYLQGIRMAVVSMDGAKMLVRQGNGWKVHETDKPAGDGKSINVNLQVKLDRSEEWKQIFEEAWRYERDYFYDPNLHGRDWDIVYERYAPLIPYVKHRSDLNYVLDQMNGELSVGHSFVGGGDYPDVESTKVGMLGADLQVNNGRWQIKRIYTTENWNPELTSPLDQPGLDINAGYYLVGIDGNELSGTDNIYEALDGTLDKQTVLHLNREPDFEGSWTEVVKPIRSERALRQRAWVEDNRRKVDSLSNGKLAYVWVPNTGTPGLVSFNRYFFAQQDKQGAVIDERYNGGGLLDDYMVDLMTRSMRAAYTNEVPGASPGVLPAGLLGPKVLLINEMAGSGGDFFPWVFRQQKAGLLIGQRTWGGLVKSSVHYGMIDGGYLTSPDNAIFDPVNGEWIGENVGIPPDIPIRQDTKALSEGRDPQLERAVQELLQQLPEEPFIVRPPAFSVPAKE